MKKFIIGGLLCINPIKLSLKMRLTVLLLIVSLFKINASTYSQNTKISLDLRQVTVLEVLNSIEEKSEFKFFYNNLDFDLDRKFTVLVKGEKINSILDKLFANTTISHDVVDRQIVLFPGDEVTTSNKDIVEEVVQQVEITGNVTDSQGQPLPGVNIIIEGTFTGTGTDFDGNYAISANAGDVLVFSFIGMATQKITVGEDNTINVVLAEDASTLNEVVITALGIKKEKRSLGYTASTVKGADITRSAAPDIVSALSGKASGVFINNSNSLEGGSTRITIRGNTSLAGGNQPLIVVDGLPFSNNLEATSAGSNRDYGSALNQVEAMDIERIDILKGTAASALYGSRGANGVLLITTKKGGDANGTKIEYSTNVKITQPYRHQDFQNQFGYKGPGGPDGFLWEIPKLNGVHPSLNSTYGIVPAINPVSGNNLNNFSYDQFSWHGHHTSWGARFDDSTITWWDGEQRKWSAQPDNHKQFYKDGSTITHNLSISKSGEFGNIRASATIKDNTAAIDAPSGYNSTNIYVGGNLNLTENLVAEVFADYSRRELLNPALSGQSGSTFTNFWYDLPRSFKNLPWTEYENDDGSRNTFPGYGFWDSKNIGWDFHKNKFTQTSNQMRTYGKLIFTPTDWLTIAGSAGLDFRLDEREQKNAFTDVAGLKGGVYDHSLKRSYTPNFDFIATLHKDNIAEGLNASISFGAQSYEDSRYLIGGKKNRDAASPFIYSFANYATAHSNAAVIRPREVRYEKKINSVFSFLDLSYKNYLYLQVTGRNDWSSTLPVENNDFFYPGASLSFIPSEIIDMEKTFDFLKFRVAYAQTGSDTDPYLVTPTLQPGSFAGLPTVSMKDGLPNVNLKSQRSEEYEIGTNFRMLNNRLSFDITYYNKRSFDQILSAPLPFSSGANSIKFNTGALELKGLEFAVNYNVINNNDNDLRWDVGMNGSRFSNKLLSLTEGVDEFKIAELWGAFGTQMKATVGQNFGAIYGWGRAEAPNGRPILNTLLDIDGNVTSTLYRKTDKQIIMGNATPKMIGGFNSNIRWKNWNLFALIDYKLGGDVYSPQYGASLLGGTSPATLKERNGGGLPYTYPSGETANIGVIMDGVVETSPGVFEENTNVVHAFYKYANHGWNPNPQNEAIFENSWVKLREVTLSYRMPTKLMEKIKVLKQVDISLIGRDLFYIYDTMPDNINPEGQNGVGDGNYVIAGALPGMRSFALNLKVSF